MYRKIAYISPVSSFESSCRTRYDEAITEPLGIFNSMEEEVIR